MADLYVFSNQKASQVYCGICQTFLNLQRDSFALGCFAAVHRDVACNRKRTGSIAGLHAETFGILWDLIRSASSKPLREGRRKKCPVRACVLVGSSPGCWNSPSTGSQTQMSWTCQRWTNRVSQLASFQWHDGWVRNLSRVVWQLSGVLSLTNMFWKHEQNCRLVRHVCSFSFSSSRHLTSFKLFLLCPVVATRSGAGKCWDLQLKSPHDDGAVANTPSGVG